MELHVSLVGRDDLTGEIYRQLRRAILDGRLPPGERLPPTRELARRLAVSRSTVTVALPSAAGLHLTALAPGLSCADIDAALYRAEAAGVELQPLSMYDVGSPRRAGLVPGYGAIPAERIEEGLMMLRRCFGP